MPKKEEAPWWRGVKLDDLSGPDCSKFNWGLARFQGQELPERGYLRLGRLRVHWDHGDEPDTTVACLGLVKGEKLEILWVGRVR